MAVADLHVDDDGHRHRRAAAQLGGDATQAVAAGEEDEHECGRVGADQGGDSVTIP